MNQTPAGWYPDTQHPQFQRYWDGTRWTEHTAPAAGYAQPGAVAQPGYGAPQSLNPYDQRYDLNQVSAEQRQAYMQHRLTEFPTWAVVVLSIVTIGLFGLIYHGLKHGQLPQVKHDDPSAGKAIGFAFIPFFNLYWIFPLWVGLVDRINFQYRLRGAPPPVSRDFAIWTNALYIAGALLVITWPAALIMWLILLGQIQSATNRLVKGEVQPDALPDAGGVSAYQAQPQQPAQPQPQQPQQPAQPAQQQQWGSQEPPPPGPPPAA